MRWTVKLSDGTSLDVTLDEADNTIAIWRGHGRPIAIRSADACMLGAALQEAARVAVGARVRREASGHDGTAEMRDVVEQLRGGE